MYCAGLCYQFEPTHKKWIVNHGEGIRRSYWLTFIRRNCKKIMKTFTGGYRLCKKCDFVGTWSPCSLVERYGRCGGTYCFHLQTEQPESRGTYLPICLVSKGCCLQWRSWKGKCKLLGAGGSSLPNCTSQKTVILLFTASWSQCNWLHKWLSAVDLQTGCDPRVNYFSWKVVHVELVSALDNVNTLRTGDADLRF